ncbi:MAG: hypothetical protein M3431_06285 [Actinomycetota bacterium]|nr:hypothetical protein [Actinomycetota bacterium]
MGRSVDTIRLRKIAAQLWGFSLAVFRFGLITRAIAALTAASGIIVVVRMYETHPPSDRPAAPTSSTFAGTAPARAARRRV